MRQGEGVAGAPWLTGDATNPPIYYHCLAMEGLAKIPNLLGRVALADNIGDVPLAIRPRFENFSGNVSYSLKVAAVEVVGC